MVKLAKKKNKGSSQIVVRPPSGIAMHKAGVVNFGQSFEAQSSGISAEGYQLLYALYALTDGRNTITLNDELQITAVRLFGSMIAEDGTLNLDHYKSAFEFYKGVLDSIWKASKIERRKAKKFGDPEYPSLDTALDAMKELENKGALRPDGSLNMTPYEIALIKQQFKKEGFDLDRL